MYTNQSLGVVIITTKMPKFQNKKKNLTQKWCDAIEENGLLFGGDNVQCTICDKTVDHFNK